MGKREATTDPAPPEVATEPTPGPWHVGPSGVTVWAYVGIHPTCPIGGNLPFEVLAANARLIAAAPAGRDLAAMVVAGVSESGELNHRTGPTLLALREAAAAVLAKVSGVAVSFVTKAKGDSA